VKAPTRPRNRPATPPRPAAPLPEALPSEWLRSFVAFAADLNFTRAARALHLSQPAVHVQIRKLSEALDAPLYRRRGQRLELTSAGRRVAAFGRELGEQTAALRREVVGGAGAEAVVLCAGEGAYLYLLGPAIARCSEARLPLRLLTRDAEGTVEALLSGDAHVGVAVLDDVPPSLEACLLAEVGQSLVLPAAHPLARRRRLTLADLTGARLIVPPLGRPHRTMLSRALSSAGVPWEPSVEASGWPLVLHFVALGAGLAVVNDCCSLPDGLVARPLPELPSARYLAMRRRSSSSSSGAALWAQIREGGRRRGVSRG
jgi:LysR family transcriptional regulator, low CO2-responsive transcriptional regulator